MMGKQLKELEEEKKAIQCSLDESLKTFLTDDSSPSAFPEPTATTATCSSPSPSTSFLGLLPSPADYVEKNFNND